MRGAAAQVTVICALTAFVYVLYCTKTAPRDVRPSSMQRIVRNHSDVTAIAHAGQFFHGDHDLDNVAARIVAAMQGMTGPCPYNAPPLIFEPFEGWGDQLRGVITSFYVALMTCKSLQVHWTPLFDLRTYFNTRLTLVSSDAATASAARLEVLNDFKFFLAESNLERIRAFNASMTLQTNAFQWMEVVRHPMAKTAAEHYGLAGRTRYELFSIAMRVLFPRPSIHIQREMQSALRKPPGTPVMFGKRHTTLPGSTDKVIGVQIRTGGVGEAWPDPPRHPLSSVACFANETRRLCSGNCTVFLTTDSRTASAEFTQLTAAVRSLHLVQWHGDVLHTSRSRPEQTPPGVDAWEKTFLDWVTLSQVDILLMSHSGFGWTAAWAGAIPYVREIVGEQCNWLDFDKASALDY